MRYSVEPKGRIYVKGHGFLSFAQNMGKHSSHKYSQKLLDTAKRSTTDAIKTVSKRAIQKTLEATGNLIGNKIADKITNTSKESLACSQNDDANSEIEAPKKKNYSKTFRRFWQYYKDEPNNNLADSE